MRDRFLKEAERIIQLGASRRSSGDLDKAGIDEITIRCARAARDADVALFFYSGHAVRFNRVNYLMPVDAKLSDEADLRQMSRVDEIVADLQQARNLRLPVLGPCRNNPLADELRRSLGLTGSAPLQRGLVRIDTPRGMIVANATKSDQTADDGSGRNSPYTAAFLRHIEATEEIGTVFRCVSADVYDATFRKQRPELSLSLIGEFYLRGRSAPPPPPPIPQLQLRRPGRPVLRWPPTRASTVGSIASCATAHPSRTCHRVSRAPPSMADRSLDRTSLETEIAHLRGLDLDGLRARWQSTTGRRPLPHLPRHLLFRILAYRLQADAFGDLDRGTERLLAHAGAAPADTSGRATDEQQRRDRTSPCPTQPRCAAMARSPSCAWTGATCASCCRPATPLSAS